MLKNYIFYQTNKAVGFVDTDHFSLDMYDKKYKPLLFKITSATEQAIDNLMQIRYNNIDQFIDIIKEELSYDALSSN